MSRGQADWTRETNLADPGRVRALSTRYASQVHLNPLRATDYVFLNTRVAPFDDARVRRAVNEALDRRGIGRLDSSRPTCQALPPNFLGYRRYCPFNLRQGGDRALARRLVAASGGPKRAVTVWTPDTPPARLKISAVADALRSLGYRVRIRVLPDQPRYFGAIEADKARGTIQAGWYGWVADYPAPSGIINPQLTCTSPENFAHFCDRSLDADIARASGLEISDPQAANSQWAGIDRRITDLAPWVPLTNSTQLDFVSRRVGNYQYHPEWGMLVDQVWVR